MLKMTAKLALLCVVALAVSAMPVQAADKVEKPEKEQAEPGAKANRAIPFRGKLASKTDSSVTVGQRTFVVTSETKIMKDGKPATLADAVAGEDVGGSYREEDGKLVAKSLRLGAKPEPAVKAEKPKKEKQGE